MLPLFGRDGVMSCLSTFSLSLPAHKEMLLRAVGTATQDLAARHRAETPMATSW